jgi:competence protein ComEA
MLLIVTVICAALIYHPGRDADRKVPPAAFLRYSSGTKIIRLEGSVPSPGIYRVPGNATLNTVINLTEPSTAGRIQDKEMMWRVVKSGDIINLTPKDKQHIDIRIYRMNATERILLGIPLVADEMEMSDWESLPGIGPVLAKEIMEYRQKYGGFASFDSLSGVPGMGEKKMKGLERYFQD